MLPKPFKPYTLHFKLVFSGGRQLHQTLASERRLSQDSLRKPVLNHTLHTKTNKSSANLNLCDYDVIFKVHWGHRPPPPALLAVVPPTPPSLSATHPP